METRQFTPFPELVTERLLLRRLRSTDAEDVFLLRSDDIVNQYIDRPRHKDLGETDEFIAWINRGIEKYRWLYWAVCRRETPQMFGTICLWNFSEDGGRADVGYEMNPAFYGQGIMDEALKEVINFGFNTLRLERIEAYTHRENDRSTRLLRRNDFLLAEGRFDPGHPENVIFVLEAGRYFQGIGVSVNKQPG